MNETAHRYDVIFIDAFLEEAIPSHMTTDQFFVHLRRTLKDDGCLVINANVSNSNAFNQLTQALIASFELNILLAQSNTTEDARIIISGNQSSLKSIVSKTQAIHKAEQFQLDARLEFNLANLISLAYRGSIH